MAEPFAIANTRLRGIRFSLAQIGGFVFIVAWVVCCLLPGGLYVHFPIGLGLLLALIVLHAAVSLYRSSWTRNYRRRDCLQLGISGLLLILLSVAYLPFWSIAVNRRNHAVSVSTKRNYVLNTMPAELVRDDGRPLLQQMHANSTKTLYSSFDVLPDSIRHLDPLYVQARDKYLLVTLGKGADSFSLLIYAQGIEGAGTRRLAPGIWFFQFGQGRWITDTEWDAGIRQ